MMDFYPYDGPMMGLGSGFSTLAFVTWLVWLVVGIFLIIWLWQNISKK